MTSSNDASGYVSNGPTSSGGASGGESSAALFTSRCGAPHSADDLGRRRLDRRAVGDVHPVVADVLVAARLGRDVEDGNAHATRDEAVRIDLPQLAEAAGDDGDAAREVEQLVGQPCPHVRHPDSVAELAHAALAAGARQHPARELACLRPGVGWADGEPDDFEALGVVDVVADVRDRLEVDPARCRLLAEHRQLLLDPLQAGDAELPRPRAHDRSGLHRDDERVHAGLVQPAQAEPVRATAADGLATVAVHPHVVVGETPSKSKTASRIDASVSGRRLSLLHAPPARRAARERRPSQARPRPTHG